MSKENPSHDEQPVQKESPYKALKAEVLESNKALRTYANRLLKDLDAVEYQQSPVPGGDPVGHGNVGAYMTIYRDIEKIVDAMKKNLEEIDSSRRAHWSV